MKSLGRGVIQGNGGRLNPLNYKVEGLGSFPGNLKYSGPRGGRSWKFVDEGTEDLILLESWEAIRAARFAPKKGKWSPDSGFYEVGFEAKLTKGTHYPGVSDTRHFQEANRQLHELFQANPKIAQAMEQLYPSIIKGVQPGKRDSFPRRSPIKDVTWHHDAIKEGVLQLVLKNQHKSAGKVQQSLHPSGTGGMANWGGGR